MPVRPNCVAVKKLKCLSYGHGRVHTHVQSARPGYFLHIYASTRRLTFEGPVGRLVQKFGSHSPVIACSSYSVSKIHVNAQGFVEIRCQYVRLQHSNVTATKLYTGKVFERRKDKTKLIWRSNSSCLNRFWRNYSILIIRIFRLHYAKKTLLFTYFQYRASCACTCCLMKNFGTHLFPLRQYGGKNIILVWFSIWNTQIDIIKLDPFLQLELCLPISYLIIRLAFGDLTSHVLRSI